MDGADPTISVIRTSPTIDDLYEILMPNRINFSVA